MTWPGAEHSIPSLFKISKVNSGKGVSVKRWGPLYPRKQPGKSVLRYKNYLRSEFTELENCHRTVTQMAVPSGIRDASEAIRGRRLCILVQP